MTTSKPDTRFDLLDYLAIRSARSILAALGIARPPVPDGAQAHGACATHDDPWSCGVELPTCVSLIEIVLVPPAGDGWWDE